LRKFIMEDKFFTLNQLNDKMSSFPYGVSDIRNKPSLIKNITLSDYHLRQSGNLSILLYRILCLQSF
jgi:hypothetical protein